MKKLSFLLGIGALALVSCSNEELVVNPATGGQAETPIGFAVSTSNMTRAGANATQLSEKYLQFGVFSYKGSAKPASTVMDNYLVGYWHASSPQYGYKPLGGQLLLGSNYTPASESTPASGYAWYYDGLGKDQANDNWQDYDGEGRSKSYQYVAKESESGVKSFNDKQYIKYWDKSCSKTWFYAYAPYRAESNSEKAIYDDATYTLKFPELDATTGANAMYASAIVDNPTGTENSYVDLTFYRLLSQVRVAFWEDVPGYKVELIPYGNYEIPDTHTWAGFENNAMFAVPAVKSGSSYSLGSYVTQAAPQIAFGELNASGEYSAYSDPKVSYTSSTSSNETIDIPLWFSPINPSAYGTITSPIPGTTDKTLLLGPTKDKAIVNDTMDVFPQAYNSTCGFTINLSLKFTALDTGEEILVKGVRVHLPAVDCRWLPNHRYTYYFKVTNNVPGSPTDPGDPSVTPGEDKYLLPIVFDDVTVEAFEDNEVPGLDYTIPAE